MILFRKSFCIYRLKHANEKTDSIDKSAQYFSLRQTDKYFLTKDYYKPFCKDYTDVQFYFSKQIIGKNKAMDNSKTNVGRIFGKLVYHKEGSDAYHFVKRSGLGSRKKRTDTTKPILFTKN